MDLRWPHKNSCGCWLLRIADGLMTEEVLGVAAKILISVFEAGGDSHKVSDEDHRQ